MKTNSFHFKFILSFMLLLLGMNNFAKAEDELIHEVIYYNLLKQKCNPFEDEGKFYLYGDFSVSSKGSTYYALVNDEENQFFSFAPDGATRLVNMTSIGRIQTVTVKWGSNSGTVLVYGSNSAFDPGEEHSHGTDLIASIEYPNISATISGAYNYICIEGYDNPMTEIDLGWKEIVTKNITTHVTSEAGTGTISVHSTAEPDEKVTVTFAGGSKKFGPLTRYYELHSYTIDDVETKLLASEYTASKTVTFTMPSHDVEISAEFGVKPPRKPNSVIVKSDLLTEKTIKLESGREYTVRFESPNAYPDASPRDTGTISAKSATSGVATLSDVEYDTSTGVGSFKVAAYNQGTSVLTFSTMQSNDFEATNITYTIKVVPREVMLVTEYDGKCYALANDMSNGKLAAQEGLMVNGVACLYNGGYSENELKWKVCSKSDGMFTIQNMEGKFLFYDTKRPETLVLNSVSNAWDSYTYSDAEVQCYYSSGNAIVYSSVDERFSAHSYNRYLDNSDFSRGAFETSNYTFIDKPEEEITIRTDLTPDKIAIVCLPYSFIAADGLKVYNLDNKVVKTETTDFYICSLDEGELTEAGRPYIIKSASTEAKVYKVGNESATTAGSHRGLYGTLKDMSWSSVWGSNGYTLGNVLVVNAAGEIKYANGSNGNGGVYANRGYMLLNEILPDSDCGGVDPVTNAPRRESLSMEGERVPTALNPAKTADEIDWNQPVYNILGQRVDRSATGVLIQNGVKIFVQ